MSAISFVLLYGISYGLILALISIGLVITMGLMRVVNLAHGAFAAIGGYLGTSLMVNGGVPFLGAAVMAGILVATFSVVVERAVFLHLYKSPELDQVLLTVGLDFLAVGGLTLFFGPDVYPTPLPSYLSTSIDLGFRTFEVYRILVVIIGIGVIGILWILLEKTNIGAQLRAAVDNQSMAEASGINVPRLFSSMFALGSGLAAFGGAIGTPMLPLEPVYPFKYLVLVLVVVALSGFGNLRSVVPVAILVGLVETGGRYFLPEFGAFFIYILLIALMAVRPDGLLARREIT